MRRFRRPLSRALASRRGSRVRFAQECRYLVFSILLLPSVLVLTGCGLLFDSGASSPAAGEKAALSQPGLEWTQRKAPGGKQRDIAWSGTQFVSVGDMPILTSPDGIKWTACEAPLIEHIIWAGSQFVGLTGGRHIFFSKDGSTWAEREWPLDVEGDLTLSDVAWDGSQYVAVGSIWDGTYRPRGRNTAIILTSTDGATWTQRDAPTHGALYGVTWGEALFVAVGGYKFSGLEPLILTSPDGVTWTEQKVPVLNDSHIPGDSRDGGEALKDVTWSGDRFVAVGSGIVSSPDGVTWTKATVPAFKGGLHAVAGGASQFAAVGMGPDEALIFSSPDGNTWTQRKSSTWGGLWGIAWGGNRFVAVGSARGWGSSSHAIVLTSP